MKKEPMMQNCLITLSDGSVHVFTGRAFSRKNEIRKVTKIQFTYPYPLPSSLRFATKEELKGVTNED